MPIKSEKFIFKDVIWNKTESREISLQVQTPPIQTSVKSLTALCLACQKTWASNAAGEISIRPTIGGVLVTCPECGSTETVSNTAFSQ